MVVAWSAPGVHTRPHGTSLPKSSRPRATGRLYSMVIFVSATCCETVPCWLRRGVGGYWANASADPNNISSDAAVTEKPLRMDHLALFDEFDEIFGVPV